MYAVYGLNAISGEAYSKKYQHTIHIREVKEHSSTFIFYGFILKVLNTHSK